MGLKRKKRLMPIAGPLAEDRAHAHYRWAERYHGYGDHKKAAAHFGRALDYSDEASFGVAKRKPEMKQPKQQGGVNQTATFKRKRHCKVCKTLFGRLQGRGPHTGGPKDRLVGWRMW